MPNFTHRDLLRDVKHLRRLLQSFSGSLLSPATLQISERLLSSRETYFRRVNAVVDHINAHLDRSHRLDELARIGHFSKFHFHRVFKSVVGETVQAFVKRLRLERALRLMRFANDQNLTQIALECGFDCSSDFSRSFRQHFGFSPREFSEKNLREKSKICQDLAATVHYPLRSQSTSGNPDGFSVELIELPASNLAYVRVFGAFDPTRILEGMNQLLAWGAQEGFYPESNLLSMSQDDMDTTPVDKYRLDWCLRVPSGVAANGEVATRHFDGGLYAAVRCDGDIALLDRAWQWLYRDWLPGSGFEPDERPSMEMYVTDPTVMGWERFDMHCCIPIRHLENYRE